MRCTDGDGVRGNTDVICRPLGDTAVLVHLGTNEIFELNQTGYRIWQLLNEGIEPEGIRRRLVEEFDADPARLDREIDDLLSELSARNLIE